MSHIGEGKSYLNLTEEDHKHILVEHHEQHQPYRIQSYQQRQKMFYWEVIKKSSWEQNLLDLEDFQGTEGEQNNQLHRKLH